uniref:Uncharacterized protein n=1 Tax=Peronospora matthiolae TaxID=2874970 RepID=A0AAV1V5U5_9STRA
MPSPFLARASDYFYDYFDDYDYYYRHGFRPQNRPTTSDWRFADFIATAATTDGFALFRAFGTLKSTYVHVDRLSVAGILYRRDSIANQLSFASDCWLQTSNGFKSTVSVSDDVRLHRLDDLCRHPQNTEEWNWTQQPVCLAAESVKERLDRLFTFVVVELLEDTAVLSATSCAVAFQSLQSRDDGSSVCGIK